MPSLARLILVCAVYQALLTQPYLAYRSLHILHTHIAPYLATRGSAPVSRVLPVPWKTPWRSLLYEGLPGLPPVLYISIPACLNLLIQVVGISVVFLRYFGVLLNARVS